MTKKTRIRVARIAAGAVIAAGASLTAAGAASAVGVGINVGPLEVSANADENGIDAGIGVDDPTIPTTPGDPGPTEPTDPGPTEPTDPGPTEPTDPGPTEPTDPGPTEPTDPGPTEPTGKPTDKPTGKPTGDPSENPTGNPGTGTGDNGDAGTCTVDLDGAKCADNTDTDSAGSKPVEQGKAKEELAETGAAETTFLLIGAATMIAGGIGFRMLPRLVGGGRTVA
ncbi:hypothetical protein OG735_16460 [Streptomyces sp. NBC_01210]|uniref:hypothetical protein n=1 Tax=Streptomyces sp. NBC_01210 TaxID=2903774 RepID=UPI002E122FA6|nr:hypothetical protein OG735_16460 [Streptomyces sp. NBC_01210]